MQEQDGTGKTQQEWDKYKPRWISSARTGRKTGSQGRDGVSKIRPAALPYLVMC